MTSERMLLPPWAKSAARRLSDEQLAEVGPHTPALDSRIEPDPTSEIPEDIDETVGGTVSRKGKFGFTCEKCLWVPKFGDQPDWVSWNIGCKDVPNKKTVGLHFPHRCKKCRAKMKRWTTAARNYTRLDTLRQIEGRHCLRFVTFTRKDWNVKIPFSSDPWTEAESIKKLAVRQFRNWRARNKYWNTRDAKGMAYYECTMKTEWPFDTIQLHFHIHMIVCSKRIENQDIQIDLDTLEQVPLSTTIQRESGGIVDVRKCRTWKHKDGEVKTSKRFVMNYLLDYINKARHWQSSKFGDWSS